MKKLIASILFSVMICAALAGCGRLTPDELSPNVTQNTVIEDNTKEDVIPTPTETVPEDDVPEVLPDEDSGSVTAPESAVMSDELFDYTFELDGTVYSLPFAYADLAAGGWEAKDADETVPSMHFTTSSLVRSGRSYAYIMSINPYRSEKTVAECRVGGFTIDCFSFKEGEEHSFSVAKGIDFSSTEEDVRAAFGAPSREYDSDTMVALYYEEDGDAQHCVEFSFDKASGDMYSISLKNIILEELPDDSQVTANPDAAAYTAPTDLGSSYDTFAFKLYDDVFSMPAPICYYIEKGWKPVNFSADNTVNGSENGYGLELRKNGQTMTVSYSNLSKNACPASDCFVVEITVGGSFYGDIPVTLGGGITVGSSLQDAIDAWGTPDDSESASGYTTSTFGEYGSRVRLSSDDATGKILNINIQNYK